MICLFGARVLIVLSRPIRVFLLLLHKMLFRISIGFLLQRIVLLSINFYIDWIVCALAPSFLFSFIYECDPCVLQKWEEEWHGE